MAEYVCIYVGVCGLSAGEQGAGVALRGVGRVYILVRIHLETVVGAAAGCHDLRWCGLKMSSGG
jgi:hypothetical protein